MKLGIVGTGNISSKHLDEFQKIKDVKIEAVCDTNEFNLHNFLNNNKVNNIRGYSSLEEMLEKEKGFSENAYDFSEKKTKKIKLFIGLFYIVLVSIFLYYLLANIFF